MNISKYLPLLYGIKKKKKQKAGKIKRNIGPQPRDFNS